MVLYKTGSIRPQVSMAALQDMPPTGMLTVSVLELDQAKVSSCNYSTSARWVISGNTGAVTILEACYQTSMAVLQIALRVVTCH